MAAKKWAFPVFLAAPRTAGEEEGKAQDTHGYLQCSRSLSICSLFRSFPARPLTLYAMNATQHQTSSLGEAVADGFMGVGSSARRMYVSPKAVLMISARLGLICRLDERLLQPHIDPFQEKLWLYIFPRSRGNPSGRPHPSIRAGERYCLHTQLSFCGLCIVALLPA